MKFIKLKDDAILPSRATAYSAGYDFYANEDVVIRGKETKLIKTDITFEGLPTDMFILLTLRSSIGLKTPIRLGNGVGVIDADYAGNPIGLILHNTSEQPYGVRKGDKLMQGIILSYGTLADEDKITAERSGGYGSTDKKGENV